MSTKFSELVSRIRSEETDTPRDAKETLKEAGVDITSLGQNFNVDTDPFGVVLLETPKETLTAGPTLGTTCTFNPWDGCKGDVD